MLAERPQLLCHPPVYYTWQPCLLTDDLDVVAPNSYLISPANSYVISPECIHSTEILKHCEMRMTHRPQGSGCCPKHLSDASDVGPRDAQKAKKNTNAAKPGRSPMAARGRREIPSVLLAALSPIFKAARKSSSRLGVRSAGWVLLGKK